MKLYKKIMEYNFDLRYFNKKQKKIIEEGFKNNLSVDEIKIYAKPEFNHFQMMEIMQGIINGLTDYELEILTNPMLSASEMKKIRNILENGYYNEDKIKEMIKNIIKEKINYKNENF